MLGSISIDAIVLLLPKLFDSLVALADIEKRQTFWKSQLNMRWLLECIFRNPRPLIQSMLAKRSVEYLSRPCGDTK